MNIIEQLEKGKKAQQNGEIDEELLRTKVSSEEESEDIKPEKKKHKSKSKKEEKSVTDEQSEETPSFNLFEEAKQMMTPTAERTQTVKKDIIDPDFDFNDFYEEGQKIYYVQVFERLGTINLLELKLRTIYPRFLVGVSNKSKQSTCIGYDTKDFIFEDRGQALELYNSIEIDTKKDVSIEEELGGVELIDEDEELTDEDSEVAVTKEEGED